MVVGVIEHDISVRFPQLGPLPLKFSQILQAVTMDHVTHMMLMSIVVRYHRYGPTLRCSTSLKLTSEVVATTLSGTQRNSSALTRNSLLVQQGSHESPA